jgi:NAD(P)-dependent dehydrogenase (short-subunit alcohol dehydrogenase family)
LRVSLVTGGGRGIGRAIALALGGRDACVAVAGRTTSELESTARELRAGGAEALPLQMDVTSEVSVDAAIDALRRAVDHVDVLVNNAGVGGGEPIAGSDAARWRRTLDTNVTGTYLVTRGVVRLTPAGARIINIASILGRFGVPGYTAYCASKHAILGFTRALALELAS